MDIVVGHTPRAFDRSVEQATEFGEREFFLVAGALHDMAKVYELHRARNAGPPNNNDRILLANREYGLADLARQLGLSLDAIHRNDVRPFLRRAALLHADGVFAYTSQGNAQAIARHVDRGRQLVGILLKDCQDQSFAGRWGLAVGGLLTVHAPRPAQSVLDDAMRALPDDAALAVAAGALQEALASPRVQEAFSAAEQQSAVRVAVDGPDDRPGEVTRSHAPPLGSPASHLRSAVQQLRRAIVLEPRRVEAHLRLGRALTLLGDLPGGRAELVRARQESGDETFVAYHAAMFLGDLEERAGRTDAARSEYGRALAVAPSAQAPRVALSHLLHASGQPRQALDLLAGPLTSAGPRALDDADDPWLSYGLGAGRLAEAVLASLWEGCGR